MNRSKLVKNLAVSLFCATGMLAGTAAFAAPCSLGAGSAAAVGNASTDDVMLNGADSTACVVSDVNPSQGPNGNTSGFDNAFAGYASGTSTAWSMLGKIQNSSGSFSKDGLTLTLDADGTWTVMNTTNSAMTLDLVLAIHASNSSGAFLFDNQTIAGGAKLDGNWAIQWLNNGDQVPAFSNAVYFSRAGEDGTGGGEGGNVPEPGSLALMGLGMLGVVALRKRNKA